MTGARYGQGAVPSFLFRDVIDAWADLEHALATHEPEAATRAMRVWWSCIGRLRAAT